MIRKIWNSCDNMTKAFLACVAVYLAMYVVVGIVETVMWRILWG